MIYYLSFADPDKFLGGVLIDAASEPDALAQATDLGLNPGGEVMIVRPTVAVATDHLGKLFTKAQLIELFDGRGCDVKDMSTAERSRLDQAATIVCDHRNPVKRA